MEKRVTNPPPKDGREWVTAEQAARMTGLTRVYCVRLALASEMTTYQKGATNTRWFLKAEVARWAELRQMYRDWIKRHVPGGKPRWTEAIEKELVRRLFIRAGAAARLEVRNSQQNNRSNTRSPH